MNGCIVVFSDVGLVGQGFTYLVPDAMEVRVGQMVLVPFGKIKKRGLVTMIHLALQENQIYQSVLEVLDHPFIHPSPALSFRNLIMARIATYYYAPFHKVVKLFFPQGIWSGSYVPRSQSWYILSPEQPLLSLRERGLRLLQEKLKTVHEYSNEDLRTYASLPILKKAKERGIVTEVHTKLSPPMSQGESIDMNIPTTVLTAEQEEVWKYISEQGSEMPMLLHGVTGSGKTEIYLRLAQQCARDGKQTLLLVPEIGLTPQLITQVHACFGDRCALLHSQLSLGDRQQEWVRIARGDVDVVVGSRSALFAPLRNYGAIIIDECHEWTYKNEQHPRYHAVTVAEYFWEELAKKESSCVLLLGSATPSIEQYMKTQGDSATYQLLTMKKRVY